MTSPPRLIVAGMHRSGTSLVASLLAAWNVPMGERLLAADRGNPAGYFEDLDFLELNRRILLASTSAEDGHRDWGWTESESFDETQLAAWRDAAAALVAARDRDGHAWGWKDPRSTLLLDFWDDVLGSDARFLLLYRHPWEVADSMLRTGAAVWLTHPDYPARIWTYYNRRLLDFHQRHREQTLLVSSDRLLRDPATFAALIRHRFAIESDAETLSSLFHRESFLSLRDDDPLPRLWRHTHPEAMELLGALDDAADLGNERRWDAAAKLPAPQPLTKPRLSVVIPCHDDGDYLIDAVASVQRNAPEAELIVVNDGSSQARTLQLLSALREAAIRVIDQPQSGLPAARNRGIAAASGEYFLPLDADNRLLPRFAADAVALLDSDPAAGVVYGDRREFGTRSGDVPVPELDLPRLLWSNYIDACAVVRRRIWSEVGGYDVALEIWEDWDFWLSAAERDWKFVRLERPTFEYRVRPDSMHAQFLRRGDYTSNLRQLYRKHRQLISEHEAEMVIAAHAERRQLFADTAALSLSRDGLQLEIDRLAPELRAQIQSLQSVLAAREAELASIKPVLSARDEELASVKFVLQARDEELVALRQLQAANPVAPPQGSPEAPLTAATSVFTIIARNYLAHARVLAASLARHNPQARLNVVVLDDPGFSVPPDPSFELIHATELPFDPPSDFHTMAAIYDVTELATAVKPWAFEHFFARGASVAIYLDPDIQIFDSLGSLEELTLQHGMLLTPHVTEPLPQDGKRPDERDLLLAGIYNLGFISLSATAAKTFLPWWASRLRRNCISDPAAGLFVDQRWLDFAPAIFEPKILKDPGYNVAYWNLPHRLLTRDDEQLLVNGQPLRFFHFSGFSPRTPHLLSRHQHASLRIRLSDNPLLAELCAAYSVALKEAGFADSSASPYGFSATADGVQLDARMRKVIRRTYLEDERDGARPFFPDPFSRTGAGDIMQRLLRPSPYSPAIPAYLGEIWSERADLRNAFPRIDSVDAERFLEWVRTQGVREHDIPPQLIPPAAPRNKPSLARARKLSAGVNVYGYAYAESGTGQIVRSVVAALAAEKIPYSVVPFTRTISRQQRQFRDLGAVTPSFDTNLICVNADQVPVFFESMGSQLLPGARNIGLWAWEVEDLPAAMGASERYLDEVWGISAFTAAALARSLTKPVRAFPLPVVVPAIKRRTRAELGMPEGFLFLFCFDYDSVFRRKNPLAVVAAFRKAFPDRSDAVLFLKTTNAERHAAESEALHAAVSGAANIVIRDAYVTSDDYFSMLESCDCYVSLHRSEGFGLTVAEAMALGKPVISTAYSSTLEFANESNSFLVPAQLVEVGSDAPPYPPQSQWAEPDVSIAAEQMRRVYANRGEASATGLRAQNDIETLHTAAARGPLLRQLLADGARHGGRAYSTSPGTNPSPNPEMNRELHPEPESIAMHSPADDPNSLFELHAATAESLLGSPRPDLPSPMQRLLNPMRRLVLRCIRVYWVQQLALDRALLAAIRTLRRESRNETTAQAALLQQQQSAQQQLAAENDRLREELSELAEEVRTLHDRLSTLTPQARTKTRAEQDRPTPKTDQPQKLERQEG